MGAVRIRHSIREFATQPVILRILLGGKPKWLPLNFGFNDVMRMAPIRKCIRPICRSSPQNCMIGGRRHLLRNRLWLGGNFVWAMTYSHRPHWADHRVSTCSTIAERCFSWEVQGCQLVGFLGECPKFCSLSDCPSDLPSVRKMAKIRRCAKVHVDACWCFVVSARSQAYRS